MILSIPKRHKGKKLYVELWKDIIDYEGLYQISNLGRVKSLHGAHKILKSRKGYIILSNNGNRKRISICKLVNFHFNDIIKLKIIDLLDNNYSQEDKILSKSVVQQLRKLLYLEDNANCGAIDQIILYDLNIMPNYLYYGLNGKCIVYPTKW